MNTSFWSQESLNSSNASYPNFTFGMEKNGNYTFQDETVFRIILHCLFYTVVIVTGIIGNILTLIIFSEKEKSVRKMFILSLTASDLCLLCTNIPVVLYAYFISIDSDILREIDIIPFDLIMVISKFPDRMGKLLTVGMMTERFIAVHFPLRYREIVTRDRAWKCMIGSVLLISLMNVPFTTDIIQFYVTNRHKIYYQSDLERRFIRHYLLTLQQQNHWLRYLFDVTVYFDFTSIITIFILSVATAFGLRKLLDLKTLKFSDKEMIERKRREKKITAILMTVSLTLCILNTPIFVFLILIRGKVIDDIGFIGTNVMAFLIVLNSAINFIIFGISDKSLREEYIQLLTCCRRTPESSK